VQPVETELGRKTQIDQSSCNRDYSCLAGDCPSFVSFVPRTAPTRRHGHGDRAAVDLREPVSKAVVGDEPYSIYMVGIGGTGVVTANQLLATAALLDGLHSAGIDQTGMSQKAGQVASHLQLSRRPVDDRTAAVAEGEADLYLVFDILGGAADVHLARVSPSRTTVVGSASAVPTASIVTSLSTSFPDVDSLIARVDAVTRSDDNVYVDAMALAEREFGDHVLANVLLLGVAYQRGLLPLTAASIERAIDLNGVAVEANLAAFRAGRAFAASPQPVERLAAERLGAVSFIASRRARRVAASFVEGMSLPASVRAVVEPRAADLVDYQDEKLARRYVDYIASVVVRAGVEVDPHHEIACLVARGYHKLLAYKDEYEVARLHLKIDVGERAEAALGTKIDVRYHLHPPVLRALGMKRKIEVGPWIKPAFRALRVARRVRGTAFDPFGRFALRRTERALPQEYTEAVDAALAAPTPAPDRLREVASAPDLVRGYEHIKEANIARFRQVLAAPAEVVV
jgi:indolepyruvate ferredoxin oxidoreductase